MDIVGIDLGTTNSLIGTMDAGFPILLADEEGERLTPSVVHFPDSGRPLVGRAAQRLRVLNPARTVYSIKRFIGRRFTELDAESMPYPLVAAAGGGVAVRIGAQDHSPEEISALILQRLKEIAERALDQKISRAVITVPAYFNDAQRNATKRAGEMAGFVVERIVNEPTAAALAYGLDRLGERSKIAVYDLGGGTFDISILELNEGVFQVVSTNGNTRLGGDDIDSALLALIIERIAGSDPGLRPKLAAPENISRLREAAIDAKHRLSTEEETEIALPFFGGAGSVSIRITREDLEKVAAPIVERTRANCIRALADAKLAARDLDAVILVGGVTRMPIVRRFVAEFFGKEPDVSRNPDEAVALGAVIQAGILSGSVQKMVLLDVTPLSLGIETFGGLMNVIIPRNSTIPLKAGEMFTNAVSNQKSMLINVLQGEREIARDNWPLGEFEIPFEPAVKGHARVGVQFEIDASGILHVLARDTLSGREKKVEIRSAVDVSDEAVEKMIAESVEHAFDDMSARLLAETRLKAEEMLPAVAVALERLGGEVSAPERERIAGLVAEIKAALSSGELQRLKKAVSSLDEGTQHLAALMLDRAMEEALRRKGAI